MSLISGCSGLRGGTPLRQSAHGHPSAGSALAACAVGLGFPAPFGVLPAVAFSPAEADLRVPNDGLQPLPCEVALPEVPIVLVPGIGDGEAQLRLIFGTKRGSGPSCSTGQCSGSIPGGRRTGSSEAPSASGSGAEASDEAKRRSSSCRCCHFLV